MAKRKRCVSGVHDEKQGASWAGGRKLQQENGTVGNARRQDEPEFTAALSQFRLGRCAETAALVDVRMARDPGQAYVALSRVRTLTEEATTLSSRKHQDIRTCCRTSKAGWRPRMYSTSNPGGIGHA